MGVAASGVDYDGDDLRLEAAAGQHTIALTGLPSRARVSADGRYGAMTVFVSGDSYLESPTAFSTRTTIVDMASGKQIGQLEQFEVSKDGKPFDAVDFNFWGVTFDHRTRTASTRPWAPAATTTWSKATSRERSMRVLRDGVECPSLSPGRQADRLQEPDRRRGPLAPAGPRPGDARTTTPVAETRSIDDQVEWLDDDTLAYSDGRQRLHGAGRRQRRSAAAGPGRDLAGAAGDAGQLAAPLAGSGAEPAGGGRAAARGGRGPR